MQKIPNVLLPSVLLFISACSVIRTPAELKEVSPPLRFTFQSDPPETERSFIPELDKVAPFSFPANDTRPPTVRSLGSTIQIIAVDDTITLYVIEIERNTEGSMGAAFINPGGYKRVIDPQIKAAVIKCNGVVANS
jgi:hypothetical protein